MEKVVGYTRGIVYYRILFGMDVGKERWSFSKGYTERLPTWEK